MQKIETVEQLAEIYGQPGASSLRKVAGRITADYRVWIERAKFCILSTVGPEGTDATPRGDDGPVVLELDEKTVAMPDWRGNNRVDALRNIVRDPRVSLLFMIPGTNNVVRLNGTAVVSADRALLERFDRAGSLPRTVTVISIGEIYFQCARALLRSGLWSEGDQSAGLPTPGQILANMTDGDVGGAEYDRQWPERAAKTMW